MHCTGVESDKVGVRGVKKGLQFMIESIDLLDCRKITTATVYRTEQTQFLCEQIPKGENKGIKKGDLEWQHQKRNGEATFLQNTVRRSSQ